MNVSRNYFTSGIAWILIFIMAIGWQIIPFMPSSYIPSTEATGEKMVLLWDTTLNGTIPTGWTNASSIYGNYFLRGDTVANVGNFGLTTHNHTAGTVAVTQSTTGSTFKRKSNIPIALTTHNHDSFTTFTMDSTIILPVYRNLVTITYDSGIPTVLPADAIIIFDATLPSGFTSYSAQNEKMIRIDSTAGGEGGSTTHTHTNLSIVTSAANATSIEMQAGFDGGAATGTHTHSYSGTSPESTNHTPPHTEVMLATVDSNDTSIPSGMIAMFNGDPNIDDSNWDVISDSGEAFYQKYIEGAASYQTGQGNATHTHTINVSSDSESDLVTLASGSPFTSVATTHTHTISGNFSDENNAPPHINVVIAKKQASFALGVTGPNDVTLASIKPSETGETTFAEGELIVVTDGGSGWSLTVIMTVTLNDGGGGHTIPDANVKLRTDGIPIGGNGTGDTYTIWSGLINFTDETTSGTYSLDTTKAIGTRGVGGSGDDITNIRPTIQVVADVDQTPADYDGTMQFTVA